MKDSEYKQLESDFAAMQPTPHRGVLDELKKAHVILLIASGLSRREAAGYVQCSHTTIGRTAARDPDFASKLSGAEATSHVQAVSAIRGAMQDPKYWRAAAWMLERRSPEEYARRDPNTFTADQVMSLLARLYSESLPLLPAEKVQAFQALFDEALDEIEAKSRRTEREDDGQCAHLASRDGLAAANGKTPGTNGAASAHAAAPSTSGHQGRDIASSAGRGSSNGKPETERAKRQEPHAEREEHVGHRESHPEREACVTPNSASQTPPAAARFAGRSATSGGRIRRFDPAQLHQPLQQGAGSASSTGDPKLLAVNELQQQPTDCTSSENRRGGASSPADHGAARNPARPLDACGAGA